MSELVIRKRTKALYYFLDVFAFIFLWIGLWEASQIGLKFKFTTVKDRSGSFKIAMANLAMAAVAFSTIAYMYFTDKTPEVSPNTHIDN